MSTFNSVGWGETHDGMAQCEYTDEHGQRFIVRRYSEHGWTAINLSVKRWGVGQIIANGQSDIDCYNKAVEEIDRERDES